MNTRTNPFPGLRAFEEEEEHLFFGREKQVDELLDKLAAHRFLAVIGTSGSGKSSLVKSGLLPALFRGFLAGAGSSWRIAVIRPGTDPIGNLAAALCEIQSQDAENDHDANKLIIESTLRRSNTGLGDAVLEMHPNSNENTLIVVDQFEELFRFSRYEKDSNHHERDSVAFVKLLLEAAARPGIPLYIAMTMRSDFVGNCTEFRGLPEAINAGLYLIPRMTREEIRTAITGPVAVGGATISPMLVNRLLNDVGDNPDQLPILQHALMRTWQCWQKENKTEEPIGISHYEQIGTMNHALSQHAEEAYEELGNAHLKQVCENMFRSLTEKHPDSPGVRRPETIAELAAICACTEAEIKQVVEVFRSPDRSFLVPNQSIALQSGSVIDISHESLMRVWERLVNWVTEESESAEIYLALVQSAKQFAKGKTGLYREPELDIALRWRDKNNPNKAWAAKFNSDYEEAIAFLERSEQEREELHQAKIRSQKKRRNRNIILAVVAVIALILLSNTVTYFIEEGIEKETAALLDQMEIARSKSLKASRLAEHGNDSIKIYQASVIALQAYEELGKLYSKMYKRKENWHPNDAITFTALDRIFWSQRGKKFCSGGDGMIKTLITAHTPGKAVYITSDSLFEIQIDPDQGMRKKQFGFAGDYDLICLSPDDKLIAAATHDGFIGIYQAGTYCLKDTVRCDSSHRLTELHFISKDEIMLIGQNESSVWIEVRSIAGMQINYAAEFPADPETVVGAGDSCFALACIDSIRVFAYSNGKIKRTAGISHEELLALRSDRHPTALAFSPGCEWLSWGNTDGDVYVFHLSNPEKREMKELIRSSHAGKICSLLFYEERNLIYLASAGVDEQITAVQVLDAMQDDPKEDPLIISSGDAQISNLCHSRNGSMLILNDGRSVVAHITDLNQLIRQVSSIRDSLKKFQPMVE